MAVEVELRERVPHPGCPFPIGPRVLVLAEHLRGVGDEIERETLEQRADDLTGPSRGDHDRVRVRAVGQARGEPVAEVRDTVPQDLMGRCVLRAQLGIPDSCGQVLDSLSALNLHPRSHGLIVVPEEADVPVALVEHPRRDGHDVAPPRRRVDGEQTVGVGILQGPLRWHRHDDGDDPAIGRCFHPQVGQPALHERSDRHVRGRRGDEDLQITGPPDTFALRAVGRHRQQIPALAPHDVVVQLGEPGVAAIDRLSIETSQ